MYLAFYKVDNNKGYGRHAFDCFDAEETLSALQELEEDEWHLYDLSTDSYSTRTLSLADLQEDYNDEELDGGYWCVVLNIDKI